MRARIQILVRLCIAPCGVLAILCPLSCQGAGARAAVDPELAAAIRLGHAHVTQCEHAAEEPGVQDAWKPEEQAGAARLERIRAELETIGEDHPWAGIYTYGDGLGINVCLAVAPESGAYYSWTGCLGLYDLNHGDIVQVDGRRIRLVLAVDPELNWCGQSEEWIVVDWGEERFLIPSTEMVSFCNDVNDGYSDPRGGFASRSGSRSIFSHATADPNRAAGISPEVPPEYAPFLLDEPLEGRIVEAGEPVLIGTYAGGQPLKYELRACVDLGFEDGLLPGMLLHVTGSGRRGVGEVVEGSGREATLRFRFAIYEEGRDVPRTGWTVSTRHPNAAG